MTGQARPPGVSARLSFRSEWEDVPEAGSGVFGKVLKATREYETHVCCHQNWLFWTFPTILDCFPAPRAVLKSSAFVIFNHGGGGGYYLRHQSVRFRHRWRRLPRGAFFFKQEIRSFFRFISQSAATGNQFRGAKVKCLASTGGALFLSTAVIKVS